MDTKVYACLEPIASWTTNIIMPDERMEEKIDDVSDALIRIESSLSTMVKTLMFIAAVATTNGGVDVAKVIDKVSNDKQVESSYRVDVRKDAKEPDSNTRQISADRP